jgi:histidinol-phosphate aminotransferase
VLDAVQPTTKIVFACTPNNPTGQSVDAEALGRLCAALEGRALLVIDEAYHEFAGRDHMALRRRYEHVVLLRTLSKFVSLAGVRCGALIGAPQLVEFLGKVLPPYTFPTPSIELVLDALSEDSLQISQERVALLKRERERLADALRVVPQVLEVFPSDANFLLVKTQDGARFRAIAHQAGILVRTFDDAALENCVRITISQPANNDRLLKALSGVEAFEDA